LLCIQAASAPDRNDIDPGTGTTLYVIDAQSDSLYAQGGHRL